MRCMARRRRALWPSAVTGWGRRAAAGVYLKLCGRWKGGGEAGKSRDVNIVYIHTHDLGDWIAPMGRGVETRALEGLAKESVLFEAAHAAAPTCSPSRAALLTGTTAHQAEMLGLAHRGFTLGRTEYHIANVLKKAGWRTALSGIQHEFAGFGVEGFPYEEVMGQASRCDGELMDSFQRRRDAEIAAAAARWIEERGQDEPYFLSVGFFQPHRPLLAANGEVVADEEVPQKLPVSEKTRRDTAALKASIRHLDRQVEVVIEALKRSGQWEHSIVIFTTDHGIAFPYHKCSLTGRGTRVALMMRHPQMVETHGKRVGAMVSHLDVVPTLYEWLGMPVPGWCGGTSLQGVITGQAAQVREATYSEVNYHAAYEPMRSIRTERYLLIRRFLDHSGWLLANVDDSLSKDEWLEMPAFMEGVREYELYDLTQDPDELYNVAEEGVYAEVLAGLKAQLVQWMEATNDPLLRGPVRRPRLSQVNHRDSLSPHDPYFEPEMEPDLEDAPVG